MIEQTIRIARNQITLETTPVTEESILKVETFQPRGLPGVTLEVVVDEESCSLTKSKHLLYKNRLLKSQP